MNDLTINDHSPHEVHCIFICQWNTQVYTQTYTGD